MADQPEQKNSPPDKGDGKDQDKGKGDKSAKPDEHAPPRARWPWIVGGIVVVGFVVLVLVLLFWPRSVVKTDDAYVSVHFAVVAPRVGGQVVAVTVDDNQSVRAGRLLIEIDPAPYRAQLAQALATLAQDRAQIGQTEAQVRRQPDLIRQSEAQVASADAALLVSRPNARRYLDLAKTGAGSQQQRQQTLAQLRQDEATRRQALANLGAVRRQLDALRADRTSAEARVQGDEAAVRLARLNLSYTRVFAPIDGTVDQRSVQVGNFVAPGAPVMTIVPLHDVFILANYRELALRHMAPGQRVRIHLDAYDVWLDGFVQSIPASTGAVYSPLPPTNATGNFTKIVQRLPVKIIVAPNQPLARLLRTGMSVETWVDTERRNVVADVNAGAAPERPVGQPPRSSAPAPASSSATAPRP